MRLVGLGFYINASDWVSKEVMEATCRSLKHVSFHVERDERLVFENEYVSKFHCCGSSNQYVDRDLRSDNQHFIVSRAVALFCTLSDGNIS